MSIPYVVGQWVRGQRFYGRERQLALILERSRVATWLLGGRRVGKTSLLRQLELVAEPHLPALVPLYWDLQGADTPDELRFTLEDAMLDAEERLASFGIRPETLAPYAAPEALTQVVKLLAPQGRTLLLLCDEAEELMALGHNHPGLATELIRVFTGNPTVRTVLAASVRLAPFAAAVGLPLPLHLGPLEPDEARSLIHQDQLSPGVRPHPPPAADVEAIRSASGDHPYLLQLLAKRCAELGGLQPALAAVAADPMVEHFFDVDMSLLDDHDRRVLDLVSKEPAGSNDPVTDIGIGQAEVDRRCGLLEGLGYLRRDPARSLAIRGGLLREWLLRRG